MLQFFFQQTVSFLFFWCHPTFTSLKIKITFFQSKIFEHLLNVYVCLYPLWSKNFAGHRHSNDEIPYMCFAVWEGRLQIVTISKLQEHMLLAKMQLLWKCSLNNSLITCEPRIIWLLFANTHVNTHINRMCECHFWCQNS